MPGLRQGISLRLEGDEASFLQAPVHRSCRFPFNFARPQGGLIPAEPSRVPGRFNSELLNRLHERSAGSARFIPLLPVTPIASRWRCREAIVRVAGVRLPSESGSSACRSGSSLGPYQGQRGNIVMRRRSAQELLHAVEDDGGDLAGIIARGALEV